MRVILFDADGVLTLQEEAFTVYYAKTRSINPEPFEEFFRTEWKDIVTGKKDLKESINENPDLWKWDGTTDELLELWFKTEDVIDHNILSTIAKLRESGFHCYLATDQEHYRFQYMKEKMFAGYFDGYYASCEIGVRKSSPQFFEKVIEDLKSKYSRLSKENIIFFDDSVSKIESAKKSGIDARLYSHVLQVEELLT